jgi:hypothetical protein
MTKKIFKVGEDFLVSGSGELDMARRYTAKGLTSYLINEAGEARFDFNALPGPDKDRFGRAYYKGLRLKMKKKYGR